MKTVGFEHLHCHSEYSVLDGLASIEELISRWSPYGDYLCVTDHGLMGAIPSLITKTEQAEKKLQPIFGCELYVNSIHNEPTKFNQVWACFSFSFSFTDPALYWLAS